jgi:hypothetical protein
LQDEATGLFERPYPNKNSQTVYEAFEKLEPERLLENVQMHGFRNPED